MKNRSKLNDARPLAPAPLAVVLAFALAGCQSEPDAGAADAARACVPAAVTTSARSEAAAASSDVRLARAIADRYIREHPAASVKWDWGEGTLMAAMVDLYAATGAEVYRDYYRAWLDHHVERGYRIAINDQCPPVIAALALYRETCGAAYGAAVDETLAYIYTGAKRTDDGGISHFGTLAPVQPTLWVDSLFMVGSLLVRWGEATGDERALREYGHQFRVFASHLQGETGFFEHSYQWMPDQDPAVYWGRGNGWVLASASDYLRVRAARGETDDVVRAGFVKLAAAVVSAQDPETGLFWTILDRPGTAYLETSATALFALGLARGYEAGALDASVVPVIARAMAGVRARVVPDVSGSPVVTDISGPTSVGELADYVAVPRMSDVHYGVGAVIFALLATSTVR